MLKISFIKCRNQCLIPVIAQQLIKLMWAPLYGINVYGIIQLMGSIEPDLPVPNYSFIPNVCIYFIQLLLSFG